MSLKVFFLLIIIETITTVFATSSQGILPLDSITFDRVISKFKFTLVKFDTQYPYGDKHEEFLVASKAIRNNNELMVASIGVQDYGDKENDDLLKRFELNPDDFPILLLFKSDQPKQPIRFQDEFKLNNIHRFVREKTGLRIVLDNCIEELDEIAEKFMLNKDERETLLKKGKDLLEMYSKDEKENEEKRKFANVYVNIMQRVNERGEKFVDSERTRVKNLIESKISEKKKKEMEARLNILESFRLKNQDQSESSGDQIKNEL